MELSSKNPCETCELCAINTGTQGKTTRSQATQSQCMLALYAHKHNQKEQKIENPKFWTCGFAIENENSLCIRTSRLSIIDQEYADLERMQWEEDDHKMFFDPAPEKYYVVSSPSGDPVTQIAIDDFESTDLSHLSKESLQNLQERFLDKAEKICPAYSNRARRSLEQIRDGEFIENKLNEINQIHKIPGNSTLGNAFIAAFQKRSSR